jgi:hypothetical protein
MAFKDLFTGPTQLCAVLLQALLNGHVIIQLFSAKAGCRAQTKRPPEGGLSVALIGADDQARVADRLRRR